MILVAFLFSGFICETYLQTINILSEVRPDKRTNSSWIESGHTKEDQIEIRYKTPLSGYPEANIPRSLF